MPVQPPVNIITREVLTWRGLHLLHMPVSLCSRKVGVVLTLKGLRSKSHAKGLSDLRTPWYLGINLRGLVPVLLHVGDVVTERNDILTHLEQHFPMLPFAAA
jgi:ganglioside-induced differentiation-associated protein 1